MSCKWVEISNDLNSGVTRFEFLPGPANVTDINDSKKDPGQNF
jgi:hypothetical protein